MNEFTNDALVQRLRSLESRVDPIALTHRALSKQLAAHRRSRRRQFVLAAVLAPLLLVGAAVLGSYYAPVFAQAVADAPIAGSISGWMLRQVGLATVGHRVSSFGDRATSSGYGVELVGGYADGARTILFLRATPAARVVASIRAAEMLALADQFGRQYRITGSVANSASGETTLIFEPLQWPATLIGARLSLSSNALEVGTPPASTAVTGQWHLSGTLAVDEGRDVTPPAQGTIGALQVSFTRVRAMPVGLLAEARIEAGGLDLNRIVPDGLKGHSAFTVKLIDDAGHERPALQGEMSGSPSTVGRWLWQIDSPGRYELRLSYEGVGTITREIVVP